ncbi:MAG: ABC transporter ATP-binding protein [Alphaproteobacteria bacterium]|nr:ABC transporter ATP-binding protein [Alphaproteobacteria bacterium]
MMRQLRQIARLLDARIGAALVALVATSFAAALLDAIGLGLLFILFKTIVRPDEIAQSRALGLIQNLVGGDARHFLVAFCGILLLVFIAKTATQLFAAWLRPHIEWRIRRRLSALVLEGYLRGPYVEIARRDSSEIMNNIVTGVGHVAYSAIGVSDILGEALLVLAINATLFYLQPVLTSAAIVAFALASIVYGRAAQRQSRVWGERAVAASAQVIAAATQPIIGIKSIKTSGLEAFFLDKFRRAYGVLGRVSRHSAVLGQSLRPLLELGVAAALLGSILFLLLRGQPVAEIVPVIALFGAAAYRLMPSVVRVNLALQNLQFARAPIAAVHDDIVRFLTSQKAQDERKIPVSAEASLAPGALRQEIRLDRVSFRYPAAGEATLREVSLVVSRGQSVGIVGASGAGKTTLVDILLGLIAPSSGTVLIDGVPRDDRRDLPLFSYVPQDSFLINDTIRGNIALGVGSVDEARLAAAIAAASLGPYIAALPEGLDTMVGERGIRLSGGQRQRIAIARAIYRQADVLVLDESTSALDAVTEAAVAEAIQRLKHAHTLIIIAHRLSTVKNCDRLFFLSAGRLVDEGSFAELVARNGAFRAMVREMELTVPPEAMAAAR